MKPKQKDPSMPRAEALRGAFLAWSRAIEAGVFTGAGSKITTRTLAVQYGARITTLDALSEVSNWFNWDVIPYQGE